MRTLTLLLLCAGTLISCRASNNSKTAPATPPTPPTPAAPVAAPAATTADADRMTWWQDARFGMFIHWGLYAIPAGEWNGKTSYGEWIRSEAKIPVEQYETLKAKFNPVKFDARAWVRMAKAAGMRYVVITTKHHDGFCLFDSRETDWDVMSTPFKRDIMREMAEACRAEGLTICWYHSIMDWHHPDYLPRREWERESRPEAGADFDRFNRYLTSQVGELLTNYGPIGVMWFDGQWEGTWTHERGTALYEYCRSVQPRLIVNNRVDKGGGHMQMTKSPEFKGDFGTPEQEIPPTGFGPGVDWETCMTMNDHWGYNAHDKNFKTTEDLIRKLADIASKGGNFLLNVGPTAEGEIPPESVQRLAEIGRWMDVNAESIRGTRAGPFPSLPWGRCTSRAVAGGTTRLYLHVFDWPKDGRLVVPGLYNDARSAYLLSDRNKAPLAVGRRDDSVVVSLPAAAPDAIDSVVVLNIAGEPDVSLPPEIKAETDQFVGAIEVTATSPRQNAVVRYTIDGSDPTARSPAAGDPIRLTQTATVKARTYRGERAVSPVASRTFAQVTPVAAAQLHEQGGGKLVPGLRYDYYEGDWDKLPDFKKIAPAKSGVTMSFDRSEKTRGDRFAFRYYGYVSIPADGMVRFWLASDDGSRLWIGDTLVVDHDGLHSLSEKSGAIALGKGSHAIRVEMFEKSGGHELEVWMAGPAGQRRKVQPAELMREE